MTYSLCQAQLLTRQGVEAGDVLAVISPSALTISQFLCAAQYLGVVIFPFDPQMDRDRRNRLLLRAGCEQVLTEMELPDLPKGVRSIRISPCSEADGAVESGTIGSDLQLIVATSGSEGEPKGVMLSAESIAVSVAAFRARLGLRSDDIWLNCLPMFHIGGIMIMYRCMDADAGMLLHQGFDAQKVWFDLNSYRVSHISLVPAMLVQLLDVAAGAAPPESLRVVLIGGGHLSPELATRAHAAGWPLCVSYGMSETCSLCTVSDGNKAGTASGNVGLLLDGFEVSLSPQGRIKVRGSAVMQGYVNPDRSPGEGLSQHGWFETGDLGEIDQSGCLRVLGRADDMLISGGNTIHPVEIEALLINCPGVDDVAVSSRLDATWGDVLVAMYTGNVSNDELEAWCRTSLSSSQRPREFVQVVELPRNDMGKLDRESVKAMVDQQ